MKKLWAFGDSFTFGHELSDCSMNSETLLPSQLTYAALIAKELGYVYECKALGYYANNAIARTVIENIDNITEDDLVLVMWTFPIRREFMLENGLFTICQETDHEFAKYYIKYADLHDHWMISQSLRDIFLTQELLRGYKYLFLSAVTDLNKTIINRDRYISPLVSKINLQRWVSLDQQKGFREWSELMLNQKFLGHPTDRAHRLLADKIKEIL
jgi:hypothetical protein